ncbi:hypothetical protein G4B88_028144 [Cannabis sativa]|uniref:Uncharacterized protein n=1 Tax=Cannabis sativa TaxID=3483 RepID=A0A7J6HV99_CANSA|nr:hypothetical protein G4B88_028144 [Cannabis sativa]
MVHGLSQRQAYTLQTLFLSLIETNRPPLLYINEGKHTSCHPSAVSDIIQSAPSHSDNNNTTTVSPTLTAKLKLLHLQCHLLLSHQHPLLLTPHQHQNLRLFTSERKTMSAMEFRGFCSSKGRKIIKEEAEGK